MVYHNFWTKLIDWTITIQMSKIRLNTVGLLRQQTNINAVKMWPVYRGPFSDFFWGEGAAVHRLWTGGSYYTFSELFCTELNTVRPEMISTIFFLYCPTEILTWSYIRPLKKDKILAAINFASSASTYGTYNVRGEQLFGTYFLLTLQEVLSVSNTTF